MKGQRLSHYLTCKKIISISLLAGILAIVSNNNTEYVEPRIIPATETQIVEHYKWLHPTTYNDEQEEIYNEILYGDRKSVV